jgi:predicted TIM-barrel enzyme
VPSLFAVADGAIVGQWLKHDGVWWNPVDPARVEQLFNAVSKLRR